MRPIQIPSDWDDNHIITIDELGELFGVSSQQLAAWHTQGQGRHLVAHPW